jgi:hypothetical protein
VEHFSLVGIATRYGLDGLGIEYRRRKESEILRNRPDWHWGPHSLLFNGYRSLSPGESVLGVALTTQTHLAPTLKKEYSYISIPPLVFMAFSR